MKFFMRTPCALMRFKNGSIFDLHASRALISESHLGMVGGTLTFFSVVFRFCLEKSIDECMSEKGLCDNGSDMSEKGAYGLPAHHLVKSNSGVWMPRLVYGTAWKKGETARLVLMALEHGFRAIDTACQPKHYQEPLVGEAVHKFIQSGKARREDIFIQTKYTSLGGQDKNQPLPYDPKAPLEQQVQQSIAKSLENLRTNYIDSLVLHGPLRTHKDNMKVWSQFEKAHQNKTVRQIGVSNFYDLSALQRLYEEATVKPAVVQNRFYRETDFDKDLRAWCASKDIRYQSFWTLTANPDYLAHPAVSSAAAQLNATPAQKNVLQVFFRFAMELGIVVLTGTSSAAHMKDDLNVLDMQLTPEQLHAIRSVARL